MSGPMPEGTHDRRIDGKGGVPAALRARITALERSFRAGELAEGRHAEPFADDDGSGRWVLWMKHDPPFLVLQTYRYLPLDREHYDRVFGGNHDAAEIGRLHEACVGCSEAMRELVERRRFSPSEARDHLVERDPDLAVLLTVGLGAMVASSGGSASLAAAGRGFEALAEWPLDSLVPALRGGLPTPRR